MAFAEVKKICKSCGKQFIWRKECYNREDADKETDWANNYLDECPECSKKTYIAYRKKEDQKKSDSYEKLLSRYHLPELAGSEKLVAWATSIRNIALGKVLKLEPVDDFFEWVATKNTAKWWIDHRRYFDNPYLFATLYENEIAN